MLFLQPTTPSWAADPPGRGPPKGSWGIPAKLAGAKTEGFQNGKCVVLRGFNFLFQILAENPNAVKFRLFFAGFQIAAGTPPPQTSPLGSVQFSSQVLQSNSKRRPLDLLVPSLRHPWQLLSHGSFQPHGAVQDPLR